MKSISYILSIILAFYLLISCQEANIERQLDKADTMLDQYPDSAWSILQSIPSSALHSSEVKARYGVLYFATAMKTGEEIKPDSTLYPAIKHYKDKGPSREKMLTHFFHAIYLTDGVLTAILLIVVVLLISLYMDKRRKLRLKMQEEELVKSRIILNSLKDLMKEKMAAINNLENLTYSLKNEIKDLNNRRLSLEKSLKGKEDELSNKNDKISEISILRNLELGYLNKMHSEICDELRDKSKKLDYLSKDMESYRNRSVSSYRKAHVEASALICNTSDYLIQNNDAGNHGKQGNPYEEYIGYKALERLTREVNTLMENILHIISTEYDLSQREINIETYSLAGFSYRAIALFLDMKPSTVSSIRTRLFNKIKVDSSPNCYLYQKYLI